VTPTSPILVCRASRDDCTDCQRALWCSVCATQSTPLVDERPSILKVKSRFQRRACAPRSSTWSQDVNIPCWLEGIPELLFVHRELTERVTFVFVIVIVPLQITAESGRSVAQRYHC